MLEKFFKYLPANLSQSQKKALLVGGPAFILILSFGGILVKMSSSAQSSASPDEVASESKVVPISVVESTAKNLVKKFKTYGILNPWKEVLLRPTMNTRVQMINYKVGDKVSAGDIVLQSGSEVQELKAELDKIDKEIKEIDYGITMALAKRNFLSSRDVKQKQLEFRANKLRTQITELEMTNRLKTPIDGTISELPFNLGDYIDGSSQQVIRVVDTTKMKIPLYVPQTIATSLNLNSPVEITKASNVEGETAEKIVGQLTTISPSIDPKTGSVYVEISIDNSQKTLLSGLYVDIEITVKNIENAIIVPESAILSEAGKTYVYKVAPLSERNIASVSQTTGSNTEEDQRELVQVEKREVKTGLVQSFGDQNWIEIKSGIEELDEIVVKGQGTLFNGGVAEIIR